MDSARDRALARDLEARARLAADPVAQIVMHRGDEPAEQPSYRLEKPLLTPRETEVLAYLSRGLNMTMTADALVVSFETVKSHLKTARTKLRAKNSTHACCEAIRRGLIP